MKMADLSPVWWGIYEGISCSSPIAYVKGTKDELETVSLTIYYGNAVIKRNPPRKLNYQVKSGKNSLIHSIKEEDSIKISRIVAKNKKIKIKENKDGIGFNSPNELEIKVLNQK